MFAVKKKKTIFVEKNIFTKTKAVRWQYESLWMQIYVFQPYKLNKKYFTNYNDSGISIPKVLLFKCTFFVESEIFIQKW